MEQKRPCVRHAVSSIVYLILTAALFVRVVTAVVAMIALLRDINAFLTVGAAKLIQAAGDSVAAILIASGTAVQVAITAFLLSHTRPSQTAALSRSCSTRRIAKDVRVQALAII